LKLKIVFNSVQLNFPPIFEFLKNKTLYFPDSQGSNIYWNFIKDRTQQRCQSELCSQQIKCLTENINMKDVINKTLITLYIDKKNYLGNIMNGSNLKVNEVRKFNN